MNVKQHLLKAKHNQKILYEYLVKILEKCPDWVSVVAFYTALHLVEAFIRNEHNRNFAHHEERNQFISRCIPEIFGSYYRLYDLGFNSRYLSIKDAPSCEDADSAVKFDLAEIEEFVMSRI